MQSDVKRRALVLGGSGTVGTAVLRELARRGVPATFTYLDTADKAKMLATELGHTAVKVDLADAAATRAFLDAQPAPDVVIHCAGLSSGVPLAELSIADWQRVVAVNVTSAIQLCQWVAQKAVPCDVVLVGGLDRSQSLPLPVHFAATQGALNAMVMATAHELGPRGIKVNLLALGPLDAGISQGLASRRRKDYETFSALRRPGKPDEAAKAIAWLALENTYIQGKVIPVNGGI